MRVNSETMDRVVQEYEYRLESVRSELRAAQEKIDVLMGVYHASVEVASWDWHSVLQSVDCDRAVILDCECLDRTVNEAKEKLG